MLFHESCFFFVYPQPISSPVPPGFPSPMLPPNPHSTHTSITSTSGEMYTHSLCFVPKIFICLLTPASSISSDSAFLSFDYCRYLHIQKRRGDHACCSSHLLRLLALPIKSERTTKKPHADTYIYPTHLFLYINTYRKDRHRDMYIPMGHLPLPCF